MYILHICLIHPYILHTSHGTSMCVSLLNKLAVNFVSRGIIVCFHNCHISLKMLVLCTLLKFCTAAVDIMVKYKQESFEAKMLYILFPFRREKTKYGGLVQENMGFQKSKTNYCYLKKY
jgi:hypothetical protein